MMRVRHMKQFRVIHPRRSVESTHDASRISTVMMRTVNSMSVLNQMTPASVVSFTKVERESGVVVPSPRAPVGCVRGEDVMNIGHGRLMTTSTLQHCLAG